MLLSLFFKECRKVEMKHMWSRLVNTLWKSSLAMLVFSRKRSYHFTYEAPLESSRGQEDQCDRKPVWACAHPPPFMDSSLQNHVSSVQDYTRNWEEPMMRTKRHGCSFRYLIWQTWLNADLANNQSPKRCHTVHCPVLHLAFISHQKWKSSKLLKPDEELLMKFCVSLLHSGLGWTTWLVAIA